MKTRALKIAALLSLFLLPPVSAQDLNEKEIKEVLALVESFANRTIGNPAFVKTCMAFAVAPELCDLGDVAGDGLVCPKATPLSTPRPGCSLINTAQLDATLGTKLAQLVRLQGEFTTHFTMFGSETSMGSHHHTQDCETSGSCAEKYVKRQDTVHVFFAIAQKGKIDVGPINTFEKMTQMIASLTNVKSEHIALGPSFYCTKVTHGEPRSCRKGPITPGGTTTSDTGSGEGGEGGHTEPEADACSDATDPTPVGGGH